MAANIVYHLELIYIEIDKGVVSLRLLGLIYKQREAVGKLVPVRKAGKCIVACLIVDGFAEKLHLRGIPKGEYLPVYRAVSVFDGGVGTFHMDCLVFPVFKKGLLKNKGKAVLSVFADIRQSHGISISTAYYGKHILEPVRFGLLLAPAGYILRHGVHKLDKPLFPGGDNAVFDAVENGGEPAFLAAQLHVYIKLVESYIDGGVELSLLKRFEDIAVGFGLLCPLEGVFVGVGGKEDHGNIKGVFNCFGCLDTVRLSGEHNIHKNNVRSEFAGLLYCIFSVRDNCGVLKTEAFESFFKVKSNNALIFYNKYYLFSHSNTAVLLIR